MPRSPEVDAWFRDADHPSIDPKARVHVSLLFHRGATIPGRHPDLEGGGSTARMRFADRADVRRKRAALQRVVRAWIEMQEGR